MNPYVFKPRFGGKLAGQHVEAMTPYHAEWTLMPPEIDLVPVMSMTDPGTFALAQDILKRHGIPSLLRGEAQAWAFGHPVLMPFHTEFGPALLVERRHARTATELLAGMSGMPLARRQRRTVNQNWFRRLARRLWGSASRRAAHLKALGNPGGRDCGRRRPRRAP